MEPYSLIQLGFLLAPEAVLMSACVGYVLPLLVDSYQTRISRDFSRLWDSSQLTCPPVCVVIVLHSVNEMPTPLVPSRTGIAPVPAWLQAVVELAHAVPAKFASGNAWIVFLPRK